MNEDSKDYSTIIVLRTLFELKQYGESLKKSEVTSILIGKNYKSTQLYMGRICAYSALKDYKSSKE